MRSQARIGRAALLLVALAGLLVPSGANAAKVVNGSFESGSLSGWQVRRAVGAGDWFAYTGTDAPIGSNRPNPADPVQPPPQGAFAAVADQANPDGLILYQDVALEPGRSHQLSLLAYYDSYSPIAVPNPDTLSVADETLRLPNGKFKKNQQFRIDVIRPEASLESLAPGDLLRTVFATKLGDRLKMSPTRLSTGLGAFAGQTVRIRIAVAVTEEVFNAGVDDVSITSSAGQAGSKRGGKPVLFSFGRLAVERGKGIATLRVRVSGAGLLRAKGSRRRAKADSASGLSGPRKLIEPTTMSIATAKTVTLHLRPTSAARTVLKRRQELHVPVTVTFMPVGGSAETAVLPVVLRLANLSK
jgi:hypothetical protein